MTVRYQPLMYYTANIGGGGGLGEYSLSCIILETFMMQRDQPLMYNNGNIGEGVYYTY